MSFQSKTRTRASVLALRVLTSLVLLVLVSATGLIPIVPMESSASTEGDENTCVQCHGDKKFFVQNKKLHSYFEQWETSIHFEKDVTCDDCHGGDPLAAKKADSHGAGVAAQDAASGVYFKNVIDTCGDCHDEILEGFKKSEHFKHVVPKTPEDQGPTCITCHGSINVEVFDLNSVADTCAECHNEESDNLPETPEEAKRVIDRFLSINREYSYLSSRIDPDESRAFFKEVDEKLNELAITWHTFDLEKIDIGTKVVLDQLKSKRDEIQGENRQAESK